MLPDIGKSRGHVPRRSFPIPSFKIFDIGSALLYFLLLPISYCCVNIHVSLWLDSSIPLIAYVVYDSCKSKNSRSSLFLQAKGLGWCSTLYSKSLYDLSTSIRFHLIISCLALAGVSLASISSMLQELSPLESDAKKSPVRSVFYLLTVFLKRLTRALGKVLLRELRIARVVAALCLDRRPPSFLKTFLQPHHTSASSANIVVCTSRLKSIGCCSIVVGSSAVVAHPPILGSGCWSFEWGVAWDRCLIARIAHRTANPTYPAPVCSWLSSISPASLVFSSCHPAFPWNHWFIR